MITSLTWHTNMCLVPSSKITNYSILLCWPSNSQMQEKWIRLNGNSSSADILIYFYPFFHSLNPPTFSSHGGSVVLSSEDTTIARPCVWYTKSSSITLNCHKILISNQVSSGTAARPPPARCARPPDGADAPWRARRRSGRSPRNRGA